MEEILKIKMQMGIEIPDKPHFALTSTVALVGTKKSIFLNILGALNSVVISKLVPRRNWVTFAQRANSNNTH